MEPSEVKINVNKLQSDIERKIGSEEDWHVREDNIIWEVIVEIANGNKQAQELAKAALKTIELDFERYYR